MRRNFSGLSKSTACASRSTAGCASRGARNTRFVAIVAARSLRGDAVGDRVRGGQQLVGGVQLG